MTEQLADPPAPTLREEQQPQMLPGWRHSNAFIFGTMALSGLIGIIASLVLSIEAIELARVPDSTFSCDVNAVVSCGAVAKSWQANLLGFPNAFLGMLTEPVVLTIGVAGLSGSRFARWFLVAAQSVYTLGLVFAWWLFSQSLTDIGAVCPWCLLITISTSMVWIAMTHYNLMENNLGLPARWHQAALTALRRGADLVAAALVLVVVAGAVLLVHGTAVFAG